MRTSLRHLKGLFNPIIIASLFSLYAGNVFSTSCEDRFIVLSDDDPEMKDAPRVTMYLDCHASISDTPEGTTLNYFTYHRGRFCQSYRICGNVRKWTGDFQIGASIHFGVSLGEGEDIYSGLYLVDTPTPTHLRQGELPDLNLVLIVVEVVTTARIWR